jgi:DNA-binding winged helix-turn-helix (wHTH) protein
VKIHISRIRSAIETPSDYTYIHTVKNVGYRFQPISKWPSSSDEHVPNEEKTPKQACYSSSIGRSSADHSVVVGTKQ